jgi:hypothetical protein
MNVTEMHIAVQQGVDKINSLQADSLLSEEIDLELNKNVFRFINTKYGRNNTYRKGFEESQKRIDDLRTLVREYESSVSFKERLQTKIFVDTFRLPADYMYLVNQVSRVYINKCVPIDYQLVNLPDISYFVLDFDTFVLNNESGNSTAFINGIEMQLEGDLNYDTAQIWGPSANLLTSGWLPTSYPSNIEAVKQDILNNPGAGFKIYWEEFETLYEPGSFIVAVDTEFHPWFNWDLSRGDVSFAHGIPYNDGINNIEPPTPQAGRILDSSYSEKRQPIVFTDLLTQGNRFSQQDDIFALLNDPFNTTKHTSPLTTMRGRSLDVYTSDIFIIDSVKITYIRKPKEISLSLGVNCELPEHTHQEIVAMTVSSILEATSDPRYQSSLVEVTKNE